MSEEFEKVSEVTDEHVVAPKKYIVTTPTELKVGDQFHTTENGDFKVLSPRGDQTWVVEQIDDLPETDDRIVVNAYGIDYA